MTVHSETGMLITSVTKGLEADMAGVVPGDIIVAVNCTSVANLKSGGTAYLSSSLPLPLSLFLSSSLPLSLSLPRSLWFTSLNQHSTPHHR